MILILHDTYLHTLVYHEGGFLFNNIYGWNVICFIISFASVAESVFVVLEGDRETKWT